MGHTVFEWVIAIAVLIVFISNVALMWLINEKLKSLQSMAEKLDSGLNEARGILGGVSEVLANVVAGARPSMIAIKETVDKAQNTVSKTRDAIATTTEDIQVQLMQPLRQVSCLAVAVDRALRHLLRSS